MFFFKFQTHYWQTVLQNYNLLDVMFFYHLANKFSSLILLSKKKENKLNSKMIMTANWLKALLCEIVLGFVFLFQILLCMSSYFLGTRPYLLENLNNACLSPTSCKGCGPIYSYNPIFISSSNTYMISCANAGLTAFPTVHPVTADLGSVIIDFSGNRLTRVPANAFRNIHLSSSSTVNVNFNSNSISLIDANAFNDISAKITRLSISNNNLNSVPSALQTLQNLKYLHLKGNPITNVDSRIMSTFSRSLIWLDIDLSPFFYWPGGLNSLYALETLELNDITKEQNDLSIFNGFANSLKELRLQYRVKDHGPNFHIIPPAVTHLHHLHSFTIDGEVYCTCSLLYLKNWQPPSIMSSDGHAYKICHNSPYNARVESYVHYIDDHCH